jgi:hypothetical protein
MERAMHRQLKERYGALPAGRIEARVASFRVDAIEPSGTLVEVQSRSLGPLRTKLQCLIELGHRIRLVKPVVLRTRIIRCERADGPVSSVRMSPRRGEILDVFDDFVGLANLLGNPAIVIDLVCVSIDETRMLRKRRPGFVVLERSIRDYLGMAQIDKPLALWSLLPHPTTLPDRFTTADLAHHLNRPRWFAQRVAYCLHQSGAAQLAGKLASNRLYEKPRL